MKRRAIDIVGVVQGVGFRPFVHALATRMNLSGFVTNRGGRVQVEVEGNGEALNRFEHELTASAPPLARIESIAACDVTPLGEHGFRIAPSVFDAHPSVYISPDVATCDACLAELNDRHNRRYRYPFINCTACGPRLTIITGSPYDRQRTTMAGFVMCARCRSEYEDPRDRRFHAEPIACADCGPRLTAVDRDGRESDGDAIAAAVAVLAEGKIVAVKGLGGFHLACDATNDAAVGELRRRKHRDEKPFALMLADAAAVAALCELSAAERVLLESSARPIVLLRRRAGAEARIAHSVAPHAGWLGVMLPYTPLHHLLTAAVERTPLVMTSGNRSDEPIAVANDDARERLGDIADLFLAHDRGIHVRGEDSVVRQVGDAPVIIRRSRGYAPAPVRLPFECRSPILAVGGQLKNTFALGLGRNAFVSHHTGDLDEWLAFEAFVRDVELYQRTFELTPEVVAYDLHPDYASTRFALDLSGVTHVGVQHHHAHVASCMAEHALAGPVIGVAWDGAGWGPDGVVWGGEFLVGDMREMRRAACFRQVPLPGGDRAAREPWRMALAHLTDADIDAADALSDIASSARRTVAQMIERGVNAPLTSSVGRLFDAVAVLCGGAASTTFEGQAAMWLESLAGAAAVAEVYPFAITASTDRLLPHQVDTRPLIEAVERDRRRGSAPALIARRFHSTLAAVAVSVAQRVRAETGLSTVVLSGGVFVNAILTDELQKRLAGEGFEVYRHRVVSPGDGGLSLGQLAVGAAVTASKER